MKKGLLALGIFGLTFLLLTPYFTSDFLDLRQKKEDAEAYRKFLIEEAAKKEAERIAEKKLYLMGKFDPAQNEDFVLIPAEYASNPNKMYLRKDTLDAYLQMQDSAKREEIDLKIASATRNFEYQKIIWNNKWTGVTLVDGKNLSKSIPDGKARFEKILEYSATPGTSRHHWGTDIDINGADPAYFNSSKGRKEYDWLVKNAYLFGFCQTYNLKGSDRGVGYNEEKWHWSYLPLARDFTQEYVNYITDEDINGFLGEEHVPELNLIQNYVLSINPECI